MCIDYLQVIRLREELSTITLPSSFHHHLTAGPQASEFLLKLGILEGYS